LKKLNEFLEGPADNLSWKLVEEDGVQYHALVTHMYVKIYFPFAARFYMMDPLVAMKSKFDLKEKLAILLFVLEHTESENSVFNKKKTQF